MSYYSDQYLQTLLRRTKTIAMVGVSANPVRPSNYVGRYLKLKGFRVIPVNPTLVGQTLFGETVHADLTALPDGVDMVDIFRRAAFVPDLVDEAMAHIKTLRTIWMQIGVEHADAAQKAEMAGLDVVQNRCPKIEYQRLFGELRMGGFNTGIISSRL